MAITADAVRGVRFAGERIVEARAYLDSAMVGWTLARNESPEPGTPWG